MFYKPAVDFDHFHYIYNLISDCESRVEKILCRKGQKNNFTTKDVVIKIGIAGHFHEHDLNLISGGTCTELFSMKRQMKYLIIFFYNLSNIHEQN